MKSAVNVRLFGFQSVASTRADKREILRYGFAVVSVAVALGIKLVLRQFQVEYPISTTFLAAIAITFWYAGTGPGILCLVLSITAFTFFVLPYQIDYRIVLPDGSIKSVYASSAGLSHFLYIIYFAFVALLMSWFSASRRRAERLLSEARSDLETKVEQRTAKLSKLNDALVAEIAERRLTEERLTKTEERLRNVIGNAPVILFALDRSGVVTLSEGKGLDAFGVKAGQLVGKSIFDLYEDSPRLHANARLALAGEAVTFVTQANNQFFEIHLIPLLNKMGEVASVTGVTYNITDRRRTERELRLVIDTIPAMSWSTLPDGSNDYCSKGWMEYTGTKPGTELDYGWAEAFHPADRAAHLAKWRAATETGGQFESEARIRGVDGQYRWFLTKGVPLRDDSGRIVRWYGTNVDIDERKRAESLLGGEKRLLEMIAKGESLPAILDSLCQLVEEQLPDVISSVLLLDGDRLRHGGAPSLPNSYNDAIDGLTIGPSEGSCGTAAYRGKSVIVSDIATDPLWAKYRDLALSHSLRACWSTPILSTENKVLGTFAMYYRESRSPTSEDLGLIELAAHLVRIAVERDRAEQALRTSEQLARSHVDVMMRSLDVLATEAAPEKFIAEMLRTIGQRLHAQSVMLWLRNQEDDSLHLRLMIEDDQQVAPDPDHPFVKDPQAWKRSLQLQEMLFTKAPVVCDDIEQDPLLGAEFREYLMNRGRKKFLAIPMFVLGEVRGFIGIQHVERGAYRPEEIELAQALAHHVMLATHGAELAEQRRHAVVLEERTRMARDIHDTLAQGFTGVIIQLDTSVEALRDEEPEDAAKHIRRARELARESLTEARRSVHALRPQALEKATFADALRAIITNTTAGTSLHSDFQLKGEPHELQPAVEENLLHIGQEALSNVLKHANATRFQARLSFDSDAVRLELCDNGKGFVADWANGGGIGLIGMRERAEQIGARLAVTSKPGNGTKIIAVSAYQEPVKK
jgi:PAS domain S-box-containing protein